MLTPTPGEAANAAMARCSSLAAPYFLALAGSPSTSTVVAAVLNGRREGAVSVLSYPDLDTSPREVFAFESLRRVVVSWGADAFAIAQGLTLCIGDGTSLRVHRFEEEIRWTDCGPGGAWWVLAGTTLYCIDDGRPRPVWSDVTVAAANRFHVAALCGTEIHFDDARVLPWPLDLLVHPTISAGLDHFVVSAHEIPAAGRARLQVATIGNGTVRLLLDRIAGIGISSPRIACIAAWNGGALIHAELDDIARLWRALPDQPLEPLTPAATEVFDVAYDARRDAIAFTGACNGANERALFVLERASGGGRPNLVADGVNDLPTWCAKGVVYVHATDEGWSLRGNVSRGITRRSRVRALGEAEMIVFDGANSDAGILYTLGPHRVFVDGPQTVFFHHALAAALEELATHGYRVIAMNGPGSIGGGRARREAAAGQQIRASRETIEAGRRALLSAGCRRFGIIAGSLGALAALDALAEEHWEAAALVSPVYTSALPALREWRAFLGDHPGPPTARIRTPLFIAHGTGDEVVPSYCSSEFLDALPQTTPRRYLLLPDEGHIFRHFESWRAVTVGIVAFMREHLSTESRA